MPVPIWVIPAIIGAGSIVKKLIGDNSADESMDAIQGGFDSANKTIRDATAQSFEHLDPYLKGGREDYEKYRGLSKSGYYDKPWDGTFTPQSFQNQSAKPGAFNPQTQSFDSGYQPLQFRPMGLLSQPRLPGEPALPPQVTAPVTPVQQQGIPPSSTTIPGQQLYDMMRQSTPQQLPQDATHLGPPGANPGNGLLNYNPQTGQGNPLEQIGAKPGDPRFPSSQDLFALWLEDQARRGGSGPYGLMPGGQPRGLIGTTGRGF